MGNAPLLYNAAPHSMAPWVIMLVRTFCTSGAWHPEVPQVVEAMRKSPGFTNRM